MDVLNLEAKRLNMDFFCASAVSTEAFSKMVLLVLSRAVFSTCLRSEGSYKVMGALKIP